jgi:hypothetical protein
MKKIIAGASVVIVAVAFWLARSATNVSPERAQKHCACLVLMDQAAEYCQGWTQIPESQVTRIGADHLKISDFEFSISDSQRGCRFKNLKL